MAGKAYGRLLSVPCGCKEMAAQNPKRKNKITLKALSTKSDT